MAKAAKRVARRSRARRPPKTTRSVINAEYRQRYEGGSCGDDLALRLRRHIETADGTIDLAKLRRLAEANGAWDERYADLNAGLARLSIGNRLRALVRRGGKIKWGRGGRPR